jgi:hypothetical protein
MKMLETIVSVVFLHREKTAEAADESKWGEKKIEYSHASRFRNTFAFATADF